MTILAFLIGAISFIRQLFVMIQTSLALFLFIATAKTDYLIDILDFFVPTFEDAVLHFIFFVSCLMLVGCVVFIFVGLYLIGSSIFSFAHTFRKECKSKSKAVQKPVTLVPTKATTEEGCRPMPIITALIFIRHLLTSRR